MNQLTHILNNWNYGNSFPRVVGSEVSRDDVLETISEIFTSSTAVVFLEGDSGIGLTSTLAQFVCRDEKQCFSLFMSPASRLSYDLSYIRVRIAEQLKLFLDGTNFDKGAIDEAEYQTLINRTRSRMRGKPAYFVIDGLCHIPKDDETYIEALMTQALPIGMEGFRFLISGSQDRLGKYLNGTGSKPYQLKRLTKAETTVFFKEYSLSEQDIDEIFHLCRGIPSRLSTIRRQIKSGAQLGEILSSGPEQNLDFINLDFKNFEELSTDEKKLVAILAFSKQNVGFRDISEIATCDQAFVLETFQKLTIFDISDHSATFVSTAHRRTAESKLAEFRSEVNDMQINFLRSAPASETSLLYLASYLQQTNKNLELVELISAEHYQSLLDSTQSLSQLRSRAEEGMQSAHVLSHAIHSFRFSLQKSLFIDLAKSSTSKAEINALVAIGKMQHAMILVERAVTKVTKLWLLAAYASGLRKGGKNIDPYLMEQIVSLAHSVDLNGEEEVASQIAEDLLLVDVNLATAVLEKALQKNDLKVRDLAFSRLSIIANQKNETFGVQTDLEGKIKNRSLQAFTMAFSHYHKNESAKGLIKLLHAIPDKNKIRLIIDFVAVQGKRDGVAELIDYALTLIIKETAYLPKAKDYADLATPLNLQDISKQEIEDFVSRFDGQSGLIKKSSVTRDWVRLSASLAYAEARYNRVAACNRLLNVYYDVCEVNNLEIQSECYARLLYALRDIDKDNSFDAKEGLKSVIDEALSTCVTALLENSASQFSSIEPILPAMIEHDLDHAVAIAEKMNTQQNRLAAYAEILELLVKGNSSEIRCSIFIKILGKIKISKVLNEVLLSCTNILSKQKFDEGWAATLKTAVLRVKDPAIFADCAIDIFKIYEVSTTPLDAEYLTKAISMLLEKTHSTPGRDDICFRAAEALACNYSEKAEELYSETVNLRGNLETENRNSQKTFFQCLALLARALGVALKKKCLDESMIPRFESLVSRLSSLTRQISLYTDLACRAWISDSMLQTLVRDYCWPLLSRTKAKNEFLYREMFEIAFPALYLSSPQTAISELSILDEPQRNRTIFNTCELLRRKLTTYDPPQNDDSDQCVFEQTEAHMVLDLLGHMTYDAGIYLVIKKFTEAVISKKNKGRTTQQQKRDFYDRLVKIIDSKLPDPVNIQHDGYKICSMACASTLKESGAGVWKALIEDARKIPNIADKAFVLIQIARCLPGKELQLLKDTFSEAENCSDAIPSLSDKLGRLEMYSLACKGFSLAEAKSALKRSLQMSHDVEDFEEAASIQKSLIDAADQLEPGFADALLELFDDDPARKHAKMHAKHNIDIIKAKKDLADSADSSREIADMYLPEACWKNLSALQANRITAKPYFKLAGLISPKSSLGLYDTYPFLCWYIENASRKSLTIEEAKLNVLPLCEVILLSTELAFSIVSRKLPSTSHASDSQSVVGMMVRPNSRDESLAYIQQWMNRYCIDYVKFCDPYFTADDVDVVQSIQAANPNCPIHILARASHLKSEACSSSDAFEEAWNNISDQTAPETYIYGIDKLDGKELIHDRWLLSKGQGLRIGTSFNSIGNKLSEISIMTPDEHSRCEAEIDKFLNNQVYIDGVRVKVTRYQI
ncbi:hypothetical protein [Pseudomonas sp. MWU13-2517]|uniref:hypothetical protein n=1 Tax=Pseudomonas sp. MWU13-2517 TaxID=2929055 RepID=UPI00200F6080|nr:hypothetical protein [Pseudomonas sp. MWU13-2517]